MSGRQKAIDVFAMGILIIPIFLILMYVALLRPQQQRVRRQQQLVTSVGVGDEVVTAGGLIGRVVGLTDDRIELEIADGVVIELLRMAISRRLEPSESGVGEITPPVDDAGPVRPIEPPDDEDQQVHLPPDQDSL